LVLTAVEDEETMQELLSIGVLGYVLKDIEQEEFEKALKEIMNDNIYLSNQFRAIVTQYYIQSKKKNIQFTDTELEIFGLLAKGLSNKKIGEKLYRSIRTIEGHLYRMMKKTGTQTSGELKDFAIKNQVVKKQNMN